eukprot:scaffold20900_cov44-Tisochrysis_lutea.AAC.1
MAWLGWASGSSWGPNPPSFWLLAPGWAGCGIDVSGGWFGERGSRPHYNLVPRSRDSRRVRKIDMQFPLCRIQVASSVERWAEDIYIYY